MVATAKYVVVRLGATSTIMIAADCLALILLNELVKVWTVARGIGEIVGAMVVGVSVV